MSDQYDCDPLNEYASVLDCAGDCGGKVDDCGVCAGDGSSCAGGCDADVCLSLDGGELNYSSDTVIAGFQFNHDGCVTGASGGEAESAGFTVSTSAGVVLGFSFSGSTVPAGDGLTLTVLGGNVSQDCLSDFVFSGPGGSTLSSGWGESGSDDGDADDGGGDDGGQCDDIDADGVCDDVDDCVGFFMMNAVFAMVMVLQMVHVIVMVTL